MAKKHHLGAGRLARQRHWHALPDGREGTAYQEFLASRRPLLARVVRDVPGLLCDPAYAPGYPAPAEPGLWLLLAGYGVSIGDLIGAGLLEAGEIVIDAGEQGDASTGSGPATGPLEEDAGAHSGRALCQVRG